MVDSVFSGMGPDEVRERLAEQVEEAQRRAALASSVRVEIEGVRESVESPRREVRVTVDASGRLLGVDLSDLAMGLSPGSLGRLLVETAARAQVAAGERAARIAADAFGEGDPAVAHLRSEISERQPEDETRDGRG